jgi:methionine aminopeptidase
LSKAVPSHVTPELFKDIEFSVKIKEVVRKNYEYLEEIVEEYEQKIKEKNRAIETERANFQAVISTQLSGSFGETARSLLVRGEESDLYSDEVKDTVVDELAKAIRGLNPASRRANILKDVVDANQVGGTRERMRESLRAILKTYSGLDSSTKVRIKELGFEIIEGNGGHYIIKYSKDDRYTHGISSSPSDPRGGRNLASELIEIFL